MSKCIYTQEQFDKILEERNELANENFKLKQQLAEYKRVCTISHIEDLQVENMLLKGKNQDKISFALEQLEKVKEFVKENESWEIEGSDYSIVYADDVLDQIDNQIKQLKENRSDY